MRNIRRTAARVAAAIVMVAALAGCTPEQWIRFAFAERGATGEQQQEAVDVAWCESRLDPEAVSPSGTYLGLFQLHRRYHAHRPGGDHMLTAWGNAFAAADLWAEQGWSPWTCQP